jgi:hypothetical protein
VYEFYLLIIDNVEGKQYEVHARLMRLKHTNNINNSLMLVVAVNGRHAELATTYALANLFTVEFTNNLLVTLFVPDIR